MSDKRGERKKRRYDAVKVADGSRGIVVSCERPHRIRNAMKELVKLLKEEVPSASIEEDKQVEAKQEDFNAELASELADLTKRSADDFCQHEICRGVGFVTVPEYILPSTVCAKICARVRKDANSRIYDIQRISPVDLAVSPAHFDSFSKSKQVPTFIRNLFHRAYEVDALPNLPTLESTWKVELSRRNNSVGCRTLWFDILHAASLGIDPTEILRAASQDVKTDDCPELAKLIIPLKPNEKEYKITMKEPSHSVAIEVNQLFIGLGVCERFDENLKYNLSSLAKAREI